MADRNMLYNKSKREFEVASDDVYTANSEYKRARYEAPSQATKKAFMADAGDLTNSPFVTAKSGEITLAMRTASATSKVTSIDHDTQHAPDTDTNLSSTIKDLMLQNDALKKENAAIKAKYKVMKTGFKMATAECKAVKAGSKVDKTEIAELKELLYKADSKVSELKGELRAFQRMYSYQANEASGLRNCIEREDVDADDHVDEFAGYYNDTPPASENGYGDW